MVIKKTFDYIESQLKEQKQKGKCIQVTKGNSNISKGGSFGGYGLIKKMFFNKPKAKYNIVNDLDSDVFNLFQVVMNQKEELEKAFYLMPIHSDLLKYWKDNKETEPIKKAIRFLFLSNFSRGGGKNKKCIKK